MTSGFQNVKVMTFLSSSGVLALPENVMGERRRGIGETDMENSLDIFCLKWEQRHEDALAVGTRKNFTNWLKKQKHIPVLM